MATIGIEIEMPVISRSTGELIAVRDFFRVLARHKNERGEPAEVGFIGDTAVAVYAPGIISSLDNAFNNLESAIGPIDDRPDNLMQLHTVIQEELRCVTHALTMENACILNFSEHPLTMLNREYYMRMRSPKPIYDYWVGYRGWNHMVGIDAKAHNGPTTGIRVEDAIRGLNAMLALSSVFIGIFANSPFEGGVLTGNKENRQTLWPRMFSSSRFPADRRLHGLPQQPFRDLKDYFQWMFGPDTAMQIIMDKAGGDYKKSSELLRIQNDPPALDYLRHKEWHAQKLNGPEEVNIIPDMRHLEFLQFSNFLDTRLRYGLNGTPLPVDEFLECMEGAEPLEDLFGRHVSYMYLEGRAAGANFPDAELLSMSDPDIPRSLVISPSAIQQGILGDLDAAERIVSAYDWKALYALRHAAVKDGIAAEIHGLKLARLADQVLELAGATLPGDMAWTLAYPRHVLATGNTGADRAIAAYERLNGSPEERLRRLTLQRVARIS